MSCRRKTKIERELVADINKAFDIFCNKMEYCRNCPYNKCENCRLEYVKDLLKKYYEEDEENI